MADDDATALPTSDPDPARFFRTAGVLTFTDEGPRDTPALIALHGIPGSVRDFRYLAPQLTGALRVVRLDLPGFGGSAADVLGVRSFDGRVRAVLELADHLGLGQFAVVGHSMGGATALLTAAAAPARVSAVVLMASLGLSQHRGLGMAPWLFRAFGRAMRVPGLRSLLLPTMREQYRRRRFPGSEDMTPDQFSVQLRAIGATDFSAMRRAVRAVLPPMLLVFASDDHIVETDVSEELARALPASRVLRFPEGGHNIQKTRALEIGAAIVDLLGRGVLACLAVISLALTPACRLPHLPAPQYPTDIARHGTERLAITYDDPRQAEKDVLFARINRDRVDAGVPPVAYEPRAALVGDLFCLDTAMEGAFGHWDLRGRAPFLRWAQAGGVDFHTENAASYSVSSGRVDRPLAELLLESHEGMMAERPPADGHRRTVLDPNQTHVGIGLAVVGGEFRMSEEFTAVAFEWIEIPNRPLRAGGWASFAGAAPSGIDVETIEIRYEPPPRPLSLHDLERRGSYSYPRIVRSYRARLSEGTAYHGGGRGDFEVKHGRVFLGFPLDQGPGHYFALAYVRRAGDKGLLRPVTAAMITAVP